MISRRQLLATTGAAAATLAMPYVARAQSPIKMRLAHAANEVHPGHIATVEFQKALEEIAPGAVEIQIFPNRQLGDDKQNLENTVAGTIEIGAVSGVLVGLVTGRQSLDSFQLPFLIRDYEHFADLAAGETTQKIFDDLAPAGLVGVQVVDIGQRNFLTVNEPVTKTDEFAGLKTRILGVPLHKAIWEAVGTNPIGLPYGEVYGALQTKVIDAVEINVSSIVGENLWEVGKYLTLTGHYPWHQVIVVNKPYFDGLPKEIQQALREAGRKSTAPTLAYTKEQDYGARDDLTQNKGIEIVELEDLPNMQQKVKPVLDEWSQKSPLIEEFIKEAQGTS
ncbi:TRAP transporter substrate-binding protein [Microbaculum marinum]|uniref:TRAP transporter substrate-binding protein n=1 Tax=Microbaculum marinum TaxID=1764581 RepID=A0AAW9RQV7_9HYPH